MPLLQGLDGQDGVELAATALAAGELVAFPTETVYGLGARADDDAAVARIFAAKGRPSEHPLIVHLAHTDAATHFSAQLPASATRLMQAFWPGPLTLIVPRRAGVATAAAGGQSSIGLRWPSHPMAQALLQAAARHGVAGVAAPSANRFGRISPTRAAHVQQEFGPSLRVLDGGDCEVGIESAIVDCTRAQPALLRPGQLGRAAIEAILGLALAAPDTQSPRASGTLAAHYAPAAAMQLLSSADIAQRLAGQAPPRDTRTVLYSRQRPPAGRGWWHQPMAADAAAAAHELFAVLHALDDAGAATIWVEAPPADAAWDGVADRLRRAAHAADAAQAVSTPPRAG
jgi:L-threonylcarbamoyladenylate synthase